MVSGPIWTNLVRSRNVIFFLKIVSYGRITASMYKLLNLINHCALAVLCLLNISFCSNSKDTFLPIINIVLLGPDHKCTVSFLV